MFGWLTNYFIIIILIYFPNLFNIKLNKDQFEVQVFKTFSSENIEKVFLIKDFF